MNVNIVLNTTDNLLSYTGKMVKVIPKTNPLKLQFKMNVKKGCGRIVKEV